MKRAIGLVLACLVLLAAVSAVAAPPEKKAEQTKTVTGKVVDHADAPLSNAVVYLKNTKTLAVKTYISDAEGTFRFSLLSPNVDYELYAQCNDQKSSTKTVSAFDSKTDVKMTLKIDKK